MLPASKHVACQSGKSFADQLLGNRLFRLLEKL